MSLQTDIFTLFPTARNRGGYVMVPCPFHKGGQERHPSMSIIIKEGHNGMHEGDAICFSCNWRGSFTEIAESFGMQYVPDTYTIEPETNAPILKLTTQRAIYKKDVPYQFSPYLASRGIFEETQRKFRIYEKPEEKKVYMPVFSREGQYLYANARATNTKEFYIESGIKKTIAYLEEVDFAKPIAICESQINALTIWETQYARATATLGVANVEALRALKDAIGPFLLMFDGDEYGRKATQNAINLLGEHRCITYSFHEGEDVNDLWRNCNFNQDTFFDELDDRALPF